METLERVADPSFNVDLDASASPAEKRPSNGEPSETEAPPRPFTTPGKEAAAEIVDLTCQPSPITDRLPVATGLPPDTVSPIQAVPPASAGASDLTFSLPRSFNTHVLCGDGNFSAFRFGNMTSLTDATGRLNHFKMFFKRINDQSFPNVLNVIFCLSLLDRGNLPATNFNSLRTTLFSLRRIFPQASLHVFLCGEPQDDTYVANIKALNDMVRNRLPANCKVVEPPNPFLSNGHLWDDSMHDSVYTTLREYLNL
jgi:hypothetical protein